MIALPYYLKTGVRVHVVVHVRPSLALALRLPLRVSGSGQRSHRHPPMTSRRSRTCGTTLPSTLTTPREEAPHKTKRKSVLHPLGELFPGEEEDLLEAGEDELQHANCAVKSSTSQSRP